jgi:hypothetical protein
MKMVSLPTKQQPPQKNGRLADDLASSFSSSSSLFWSMVTPMFYIGLGILLYQHWMATTSISAASSSSLNNMATTTTASSHPPPVTVSPTLGVNDDGCRFITTLTDYRVLPPSLLQPPRNDDLAQMNIQQQQLQYNDTTGVSSSSLQSIDPTKVIFYHLNVPETYGAYWNRYMARTYHAVCGPYAYSIDQPIDIGLEPKIHPTSSSLGPTPDRTKTWQEMQELGWHNCQWITGSSSTSTSTSNSSTSTSVVPADSLSQSVELIQYLQQLGFHVHMVIPCPQDVVSHRLSICSAVGAPLSTWMRKKMDNDKNEDALCSRLIRLMQNCDDTNHNPNNNNQVVSKKKNYYYDATLIQTVNSSSFVGFQDLAQVDRLVAGYLPERGYLLPRLPPTTNTKTPSFYFSDDETTTTTTTPQPKRKQYSQPELQEVLRRCGARVQEHFQSTIPLYQACAKARQPKVTP